MHFKIFLKAPFKKNEPKNKKFIYEMSKKIRIFLILQSVN